jgi:hypothetical protein
MLMNINKAGMFLINDQHHADRYKDGRKFYSKMSLVVVHCVSEFMSVGNEEEDLNLQLPQFWRTFSNFFLSSRLTKTNTNKKQEAK